MCTIEEIRDLIHEELFNPKEDGKSRLSREIESHIDNKLNQLFWRLVKWMGTTVVVLIISATVAWTNMQNQVEQNTAFRNAGDRFTAQDGEMLQQQINDSRKQQERMEAWLIRIEGKLDQAIK
jgi:hypothetical protein